MRKLSEEDKEQLDYIHNWYKAKEKKKEENEHRKRMRKFHLARAKWYLKKAFEDLKQGLFV